LFALAGLMLTTIGAIGCGTRAMGSSVPPMCGPFGNPPAITMGAVKPDCPLGTVLGPWIDLYGDDRYACVWEPYPASKDRLPLVIYLHPSLFGPKTVAKTGLLLYQDSVSLSADGKTAGYIVLAPLARKTLHNYPRPDDKGLGWDNWYRQLNPAGDVTVGESLYHENVDAAAIDHFVAQQVAAGKVDPSRIYITGWSNGAAMAYLYALNRPDIAAVAAYSAPDPFGAFNDPCPQTPVKNRPANDTQIQIFNPSVPAMHLHNSCDIAGMCPNSERMEKELKAAGDSVHDTIIDYSGNQVNECTLSCGASETGNMKPLSDPLGYSLGFVEHARWPTKWTPLMLDFLRSHSLNSNPSLDH
jgi:dienelactone hydrolase